MNPTTQQRTRTAKLLWVPLKHVKVRGETTQRRYDPRWADRLFNNFDPECLLPPVVNHDGDTFYVMEGQHITDVYKRWLGDDWRKQKLECWVYENLTEQEEAEFFDKLNTRKSVHIFDRFRVRLTAGCEDETNVAAIVRLKKLTITRKKQESSIACVGALLEIYRKGADTLSRDLDICYGAFGDSGLESDILKGLSLLISRYDGKLDDKKTISALSRMRGGAGGLRTRAARIQLSTGVSKANCIAASVVEVVNRTKGGKKLTSWWKEEQVQRG